MATRDLGVDSARDNSHSNVISIQAWRAATGQISFRLALGLAREAKAWSEYVGAKASRERIETPPANATDFRNQTCDQAFEEFRLATMRMALIPVGDAQELRLKKGAMSVWLTAKGAWYDQLRAAVARDEAAFPAKRRPRKIA